MSEYEKYYRESLYPFQDGILAIVKRIDAPFYLTGGTAIGRYHNPVRYSDDLDLFVNRDPDFSDWVERLYRALEIESRGGAFSILSDRTMRYEDYVQLSVAKDAATYGNVIMSIDMVNDVAPHYGDIQQHDTFGRVDSWRNILSNKVTALYRVEPKDVVDLWALATVKRFNWAEIVREASSKEAGLDPVILYDLVKSFPDEGLSGIKWTDQGPEQDTILKDLSVMAEEIFEGQDNSLAAPPRP